MALAEDTFLVAFFTLVFLTVLEAVAFLLGFLAAAAFLLGFLVALAFLAVFLGAALSA